MPRLIKSARAKPGSNPPVKPPPKAAPPSPQFTESQQSSSPSSPNRPENSPDSADGPSPEESPKEKLPEEKLSPEELSLDATEPFPPDLFRLPVPNKVFSEMPGMSDSALRCLLGLIYLSFRFDPAESEWVHGDDWLTRSDVETECGLSSQGTRNGLDELESIGWVCVDRSGRSHRYQLKLEVPSRRFTYVPTALLEHASGIGSGTKLRVALAVLRGTWGWTCKEKDSQSGDLRVVHDRWEQLSNRELAEATGRSETAVGEAAKALQGTWIERVRPGSGPHQYRFLPEAVGDGSGNPDSFSEDNANDLAPGRQKSGTPTSYKENSPKDKHSQSSKSTEAPREKASSSGGKNAVRAETNPEGKSDPEATPDWQKRSNRERNDQKRNDQKRNSGSRGESPTPDFSSLPPEKQELAKKLKNVGVWAGRIAEILSRFSPHRIRANFDLYRKRAAEQTIRKPGAWLYRAITEGYTLPSAESGAEDGSPAGQFALDHKETVSEAEKDAYVAQGIDEERFHRCLSPGGSSKPRFMYFAPEEGGPERRV